MYTYYRSITIDHTKCGTENTSNFAILFSGTYIWLKTTANGGRLTNANGYDFAFFSDSGLTTALSFERVSWSATTGKVECWVKIPTLTYESDGVIYIGYGDSEIEDDQSDKNNVWDEYYKAVWHLEDLNDSTSNTHNLTNTDTTVETGKIGSGKGFVANQYLTTSDSTDWNIGSGDTTWEIWANSGSSSYARCMIGQAKGDASKITWYSLGAVSSTAVNLRWDTNTPGGNLLGALSTGDAYPLSTWSYFVFVKSGTVFNLYTNGGTTPTASVNSTVAPSDVDAQITVGRADFNSAFDMSGYLDEIKLSFGTARSTSYLTSSYNNQNDPSTFYSIGDEVDGSSSGGTKNNILLMGV